MVYIYLCPNCAAGNHILCARSELPKNQKEGKIVFGGRRCRCFCKGDPNYGKPSVKTLQQTFKGGDSE